MREGPQDRQAAEVVGSTEGEVSSVRTCIDATSTISARVR